MLLEPNFNQVHGRMVDVVQESKSRKLPVWELRLVPHGVSLVPILAGFCGFPAPQGRFSGVAAGGLFGLHLCILSWGDLGRMSGDPGGMLGVLG